ncbi:hypothetical protein KV580_27030 [Pseudomonas chlororaphis]|nr:hypothetical protein [Pseudomonas chlororaphis]
MRDPASKYDLTSTENLLNRNISNQGDKLNASIRELRTSIKEQNESIATLSKIFVDKRREFCKEIAEEIALNNRRERDKAKEQRSDRIGKWMVILMTTAVMILTVFKLHIESL